MKKFFCILIALLLALPLTGCGRDREPARVWQTRDTVEAYAVDGFKALGKASVPKVTTVGEGDYPYPSHEVSGARAAEVKAESQALYATLAEDIENGTVKKHAAADAQFSVSDYGERIIRKMTLAGEIKGAHPTGLYLPAGEIVTVSIPAAYIEKGFRICVNYGFPELTGNTLKRMPQLYYEWALDKTIVKIASPFGGLLDVLSPGGSAELEISGAMQAPFYRYGADAAPSTGVGFAQIWLGNLYITAPADALSDSIDEVCAYWRGVVERMGLTDLTDPLRIVFDDGNPDRAKQRFSLADADVFFNPARLYAGEGTAIFEGLANAAEFGFVGRAAAVKALTTIAAASMTEAGSRRSTGGGTVYDPYGILSEIKLSGESFTDLDAGTRAAFFTLLYFAYNADVPSLLKAGSADAAVKEAAAACGTNLEAYAELFKVSISEDTRAQMRAYKQSFYPIGNLFASGERGAPYIVAVGSTRLDFGAFTADPAGVFKLTKVKGEGLKKAADGVYDFIPAADCTTVTLTYKNTVTKAKTTVTGRIALAGKTQFVPDVPEISALGRLAPFEANGVTVNAPFITPVTHSTLEYSGDFEARTDGAYYAGTAAYGKSGAKVTYAFYGEAVAYFAYPAAGSAKVYLDGKEVAAADLHNISSPQAVYSATGLKGKHTLSVECASGEISVAYFAVAYDPNMPVPFPRGLRLTLLLGGILIGVAGIIVLLFLLVFPLINKYKGTDIPCRNFKSETQKKRDKAQKAKMKYDKLQAKTKTVDYDAYDDSWVPTVILPPVTKAADADCTPRFTEKSVRAALSETREQAAPPKKEKDSMRTVTIPLPSIDTSTETDAPKPSPKKQTTKPKASSGASAAPRTRTVKHTAATAVSVRARAAVKTTAPVKKTEAAGKRTESTAKTPSAKGDIKPKAAGAGKKEGRK